MPDSAAPVAGWYDDPEMALRLRWWDGARWTQHTRAKPIVEAPMSPASHAPVGGGTGSAEALAATIAEPAAAEPYGYSAPGSWSPGSAPVAPAAASTQQLGTYGARSQTPEQLWGSTAQQFDYVPERVTTPAAWALAVTPLVTLLSQSAAVLLSGFESTPWIWLAGAAVVPILWIVVWVRRDRIALHEWGHLRRPSGWWALLLEPGYLIARTIAVRGRTGRGWWPLVVNLALIAVLVNVGLFSPVFWLVISSIV